MININHIPIYYLFRKNIFNTYSYLKYVRIIRVTIFTIYYKLINNDLF